MSQTDDCSHSDIRHIIIYMYINYLTPLRFFSLSYMLPKESEEECEGELGVTAASTKMLGLNKL